MIVVVTTDVPCGQHPNTTIAVGKLGALAGKTTTTSEVCTEGGTIGTLVIVPSGEDNDEIAFEVTTGIGVDPSTCANGSNRTCIVARRDLHFLPHETIRVTVPMKQICAGVSCEPDSTCYAGACVSATIDQSCVDGVCGEDTLGPTTATDGGSDVQAPPVSVADTGPRESSAADVEDVPDVMEPDVVSVSDANTTGDVTDIVFGEDHTCMLTLGKTYCWGDNHDGEMGINVLSGDYPIPTLTHAPTATKIATSQQTVAVLTPNHELYMWGFAGSGAILGTSASYQPEPKKVTGVGFPVDHGWSAAAKARGSA